MIKMTDDARTLSRAADILAISEFQLFVLSYRSWFGRDADVIVLEQAFDHFLNTGELPLWVRDFVRKTVHLADDFVLLTEHDAQPYQSLLLRWIKAMGILVLLMSVFLVLVLLASGTQEQVSQHCILPVCH